MELTLISLATATLVELLLWFSPAWKIRKFVASLLVIDLGAVSGQLLGTHLAVSTSLLAVFNIYRIINLLRVIEGRTTADYLFLVARRSSLMLMAFQVIVLGGTGLQVRWQVSTLHLWYVLAIGQVVVAAIVFASTHRHLRTTKPPKLTKAYADRELPSLTVAIPARNETEDLEECLLSLLKSTYPKLEILVLDDCSQNKRTPEIIRKFAHDGVRFISGEVPPDKWLAKNYAYEQLFEEANGKLILFCGVDVRFEPDTLKELVETSLQKKKAMMSVLPRNQMPERWSAEQVMVQPSRYAWELALPRRWLNRPPVLSTCWLITTEALHAGGGFKAVSHNSSPESYFARITASRQDGYSFICSDERIGLTCRKSLSEQRATAVRTRYPQLHRRLEVAALLTLTELTVLLGPLVLAIIAGLHAHWLLMGLGIAAGILVMISYARLVDLAYRHFLIRGLWLLPFAAVYDVCLLNYSLWQYEFNEVIWKGRNVCLPIMRVYPGLPKV